MAILSNGIPYSLGVQSPMYRSGNSDSELIAPINNIQDSISTSLDTISEKFDEEKKKKSNKTAFAVGLSTFLVMGGVVLLNPKYSTKFAQQLNTLSSKAKLQVEKNKDNFLKSNFYKISLKCLNFTNKTFTVVNNINSSKDIGFKYLCTENKYGDDKPILRAIKAGILKITKPFHEGSTKFFDSIGRKTVQLSHKKARNKFENLDDIIKTYRSRLSSEDATLLDSKLAEIKKEQQFFDEASVNVRLDNQGAEMNDLEDKLKDKALDYIGKIKNASSTKMDKNERLNSLKDGTDFWAEDILAERKEKVMQEAKEPIGNLFGNNEGSGLYADVVDILRPKLSKSEEDALNKIIVQTERKAQKTATIETSDYFDKKRDLILGSSPTDIVSGLILIGASGIAIGKADSKDDKLSKFVTMGAPAVLGVGTSLLLAATLVSGAKCIIAGALSGAVLSKIGNLVNHKIFGNKSLDDVSEETSKTNKNTLKTNA